MKLDSYQILFGQEQNYSRLYDAFFFNEEGFLSQFESKPISFYLLHDKKEKIVAEIHFYVSGEKAVSPFRASFGSIQFAEGLKAEYLEFFLHGIEEFLKEKGIREIVIKNYPFSYSQSNAQLLTSVLIANGYEISTLETSFHLALDQRLDEVLKQSELTRIKAGNAKGMKAELWENPDLELTYSILKECRDDKAYPMTLPLTDFKAMFEKFPDTYKVFKVDLDSEIIAVAVTVHINADILYNFYVGDLPKLRSHSSVAFLINVLFEYAKAQNYKILDLGIGTEDGTFNHGLMRFKQNMGALASLKPIFAKRLEKEERS